MQANNSQFIEVTTTTTLAAQRPRRLGRERRTNPCGTGVSNSDTDTNCDVAMSCITADADAGKWRQFAGRQAAGNLVLRHRRVEDEMSRQPTQSTMTGSQDWCTPLKNNGIKIGRALYGIFRCRQQFVQYVYRAYSAEHRHGFAKLRSSGLFYGVGLGQDRSAALTELFQSAVASGHLDPVSRGWRRRRLRSNATRPGRPKFVGRSSAVLSANPRLVIGGY